MTVDELAARITTVELAEWAELFREEGEALGRITRTPKASAEGITAAMVTTIARR